MDYSYAYGLRVLVDDDEPAPPTVGLELEEDRGRLAEILPGVLQAALEGGDAEARGPDLREELRDRTR
jgi:hypothetical protein